MYYFARVIKKTRGVAIKHSRIHRSSKIESGSQVICSEIGRNSYCGYDCKVINCTIGSFTSIADDVRIGLAQHPIDWVSTSPVFQEGRNSIKKKYSHYALPEQKKTIIGDDVWIGERVLVKSGVSIGNGAVVGMGSVVTKDIPPYEIWAGNPARKIKDRFDTETKCKLMETSWWDLPDEKISILATEIRDPRRFLKKKEAL